MSKEWQYTDDWCEEDMLDGSHVGYVYMFYFPNSGEVYFGAKQIWQRVKDIKKLKIDSKENGWRNYTSSSKTVNEMIASGEEYTKTILWCFPTMKETLLIESMLIMYHILDSNCLNKAVLNKLRAPSASEKRRLKGILTDILERVNYK
ncbi:TPA: hypothetical protein SMH10_001422 [Klebsiella oxytoca]|jgi:hypothetical protein|nr:hypothetical protein [Klebsiella oxytoca]QRS58063.1 hypothetical protein I6K62_14180 [Klebsiella oxytoca]RWT35991.1 hypothetical protein DN619_32300 [Klebsiella michiganensis]HEJ7614006.1 hypothetical protein [Klebsiella oxytoca]HEJ8737016.1 hypothetical protein [Klebsiella oxytoca]